MNTFAREIIWLNSPTVTELARAYGSPSPTRRMAQVIVSAPRDKYK